MPDSLKDFLNHGILPFVGRATELDRLFRFWLETVDANHPRALLLVGEAGIGKSRLVEELLPRITRAGGTVIHAKLYPESTASIVPLISKALRLAGNRRRMPVGNDTGTLSTAIHDLKHLARLRPTLLLLEDIHLLGSATLPELSLLLESLAEEMLTVLFVARPVELPAREVITPYVHEEMHLEALLPEHVDDLLDRLFSLPLEADMVSLLMNVAQGNPLALRSAIRGTIHSGALKLDAGSNRWRVTFPPQGLTRSMKQNIAVLSEGMISHLSEEERRAAECLACLGEVFAREAAEMVLSTSGRMLDRLIFKGIIAPAVTPATLLSDTRSASAPLAFTHTNLHKYLSEHPALHPALILRLIAAGVPLYSMVPFQILERHNGAYPVDRDTAHQAIRHAVQIATALNTGPDWRLAGEVWNTATAIRRNCIHPREQEEDLLLEAELLACRLELLRRMEDVAEYTTRCEALLALTDHDTPETPAPEAPWANRLREYRLRAFAFRHVLGRRTEPTMCLDTWQSAREFIARHPKLRHSTAYIEYLESAARSMLYMAHDDIVRVIELELRALADDPATSPEHRRQIEQITAFYFLDIFHTPEGLRGRIATLERMGPITDPTRRANFLISKISFLFSTGMVDAALACVDEAGDLFKELGLASNHDLSRLTRYWSLALLNGDMEGTANAIERLCAAAGDGRAHLEVFAHMGIIDTAVLLDEMDWLRGNYERYALNAQYCGTETQLLMAAEGGTPPQAPAATLQCRRREMERVLGLVLRLAPEQVFGAGTGTLPHTKDGAQAEPATAEALIDALRDALRAPLLRLNDLLERRLLLAVILGAAGRPGIVIEHIADPLHAMFNDTLHWLSERALPALMAPFLDRYGTLLPPEQLHTWQAHIVELARERAVQMEEIAQAARERKRVTMLGMVQFFPLRGQPIPIRGSRLRTLLGLMVASAMHHEGLPHREFSTIVAGTDDPDKARKTLNGVVFRLRELLGHDEVLTEQDTPRLNLDLVDVDLIEAHNALQEAAAALRGDSLLRAARRVRTALDITRGQVPFPSLYDDFFERTRAEFEHTLRTLLLKVARGLLAEQDPQNAQELLRSGFAAMAEDEELAELLCAALEMEGKHAEAERVRMRMSESSDQ